MDNKNDFGWTGIKRIVGVTILVGSLVATCGLYNMAKGEEIERIKTKKQCVEMVNELFKGDKETLRKMLKEDKLPSYVVKAPEGYIINLNETLWLVNNEALAECLD